MIHEPSKEAPKNKQTITVYFHKRIDDGREMVTRWESWGEPGEYVLLAKQDVTFDLLMTEAEMTALAVAGLETQITKTRADAQAKVQMLQDRIQSLLSITHQAEA
jgi:hypothetical protein